MGFAARGVELVAPEVTCDERGPSVDKRELLEEELVVACSEETTGMTKLLSLVTGSPFSLGTPSMDLSASMP